MNQMIEKFLKDNKNYMLNKYGFTFICYSTNIPSITKLNMDSIFNVNKVLKNVFILKQIQLEIKTIRPDKIRQPSKRRLTGIDPTNHASSHTRRGLEHDLLAIIDVDKADIGPILDSRSSHNQVVEEASDSKRRGRSPRRSGRGREHDSRRRREQREHGHRLSRRVRCSARICANKRDDAQNASIDRSGCHGSIGLYPTKTRQYGSSRVSRTRSNRQFESITASQTRLNQLSLQTTLTQSS